MDAVLQFLKADTLLSDGIQFLLFLIAVWFVTRIVKWVEIQIGRKLVQKKQTTLDDNLLNIFSLSSGRLIWVVGLY